MPYAQNRTVSMSLIPGLAYGRAHLSKDYLSPSESRQRCQLSVDDSSSIQPVFSCSALGGEQPQEDEEHDQECAQQKKRP
jgi:hypothetical protein